MLTYLQVRCASVLGFKTNCTQVRDPLAQPYLNMSGIANAYVSCYNISMYFGETYHYTPEEERELDALVDEGVANYEDARAMLGIQPDLQPERPAWVDEIAASIPLGDAAEVVADERLWSPINILDTLHDDERLPDWGKLAAGDKD